jgi:hypothetical protein
MWYEFTDSEDRVYSGNCPSIFKRLTEMETVKEKAEKVLSCIEKLKEVGEATSFELISRYTNIDDTELQEVARYMETEGLANLVTLSNGSEDWHYLVTITRGIDEDEVFDFL